MKVYFDVNVIHKAMAKEQPEALRKTLKNKGIEPCLGRHLIYEAARCFLDEDKSKTQYGKNFFSYLEDLDFVYFLKEVKELVSLELNYAKTGGYEIPFLNSYETNATKQEINRLSRGIAANAIKFISKRESNLLQDAPEYRSEIMKTNKNKPHPDSFEAMRDDWYYRRQILTNGEFRNEAQDLPDSLIFLNPEKYPVLNTYISAQIYFNYVALSNPQGPSKNLQVILDI